MSIRPPVLFRDHNIMGKRPYVSGNFAAAESRAFSYALSHGARRRIVLADAHFPGHSTNANTLRADGLKVADLLDAILPLFPLDSYVDSPVFMMAPVPGDQADPAVERAFRAAVARHWPETPQIALVERFALYEQTRTACCVVQTGRQAQYGHTLPQKGLAEVRSGA